MTSLEEDCPKDDTRGELPPLLPQDERTGHGSSSGQSLTALRLHPWCRGSRKETSYGHPSFLTMQEDWTCEPIWPRDDLLDALDGVRRCTRCWPTSHHPRIALKISSLPTSRSKQHKKDARSCQWMDPAIMSKSWDTCLGAKTGGLRGMET